MLCTVSMRMRAVPPHKLNELFPKVNILPIRKETLVHVAAANPCGCCEYLPDAFFAL